MNLNEAGVLDPGSDNQLMLRVRGGDLEALGLLFERHHRRVFALCYRLVGERGAAEDLTQDTFLRVLRFRHGFKGAARFTTWLYRIARNQCLDYLRAERGAGDARPLPEPVTPSPGAELETVWYVRTALARLTPADREVIVLAKYHDLPYEEIARVCECSVSAVKTRVHRAMRRLRDICTALEEGKNELRTGEDTDHRRANG